MIKLLGDESGGVDGKLIVGGEGVPKKKKKKKPAETFMLCFNYVKVVPNWLK